MEDVLREIPRSGASASMAFCYRAIASYSRCAFYTKNEFPAGRRHQAPCFPLATHVALSRPPSLAQLISVGLPDELRKIIEAGPPEGILTRFNDMFQDLEVARAGLELA